MYQSDNDLPPLETNPLPMHNDIADEPNHQPTIHVPRPLHRRRHLCPSSNINRSPIDRPHRRPSTHPLFRPTTSRFVSLSSRVTIPSIDIRGAFVHNATSTVLHHNQHPSNDE